MVSFPQIYALLMREMGSDLIYLVVQQVQYLWFVWLSHAGIVMVPFTPNIFFSSYEELDDSNPSFLFLNAASGVHRSFCWY